MTVFALMLLTGQPAAQLSDPPKPKLVCRESERRLGSHVRTGRRCKTAQQWEEEDAERDRVPVTLRVTAGQGDAAQPTRKPQ
jgi:hypothetical protein